MLLNSAGTGFAEEPLGLTAGADGQLLLRGEPFRGLGVNYYDAFARTLSAKPARSTQPGFRALASNGIPFIRFAACGYWPVDWALYRTNRAEYFERLAGVVRVAEKYNVGLMPSLFWHQATISDLVEEPLDH